jgi:phage FluMu gp28-like protein
VVPLLPYQERWIADDAKLKIVVKSRQTGFSFAGALRAVLRCLERRTTWILLSKGERQSKLLMEKVQDHVKAIGAASQYYESNFMEGTLTKQLEVRFPNGSVIYGLPANPDTARGYSGHATLDEFAFHADSQKIYAALFPTISRGFGLELISTPNGQQGKFYEIAKAAGLVDRGSEFGIRDSAPEPRIANPESRPWSGHRVTIYDAVRQGLPWNIDELRRGVDDEETWQQEYCCAFLSDAANYIPMELIMGCVSEEATTEWSPESEVRGPASVTPDAGHRTSDLYLGVDIGRKRDLTVAWLFEKLGDVLWSRELLTMKGTTFDAQEKAIDDLIIGSSDHRAIRQPTDHPIVRRCCIDQSGLGLMLAERLAKKYGAIVEPVQFTAQVKERLAPMVKQLFEDRLVRIPDNREIRADINAVKRFVTPAGNVRFDAEHTDKGHADRFWALALAANAACQPTHHFAEAAALVGKPIVPGMRARAL